MKKMILRLNIKTKIVTAATKSSLRIDKKTLEWRKTSPFTNKSKVAKQKKPQSSTGRIAIRVITTCRFFSGVRNLLRMLFSNC